MTKELTRLIMKYTCSDETKTEEAESLTPEQDTFQDSNYNYQHYITNMGEVKNMIRCGESFRCEHKRNGNCENAQDPCPIDIVRQMWENGKSAEYIADHTNYNELEIHEITTK